MDILPGSNPETNLPIWVICLIALASAQIVFWVLLVIIMLCVRCCKSKPKEIYNIPQHSYQPNNSEKKIEIQLIDGGENHRVTSLDSREPEVIANMIPMMELQPFISLEHNNNTIYPNERAENFYHEKQNSQASSLAGAVIGEPGGDMEDQDPAHYIGKVLSRPVTIRQLQATIKQHGYLEEEFKKLPPNQVDPSEIPQGADKKNRYCNVLPNLRTRVPISQKDDDDDPCGDYINASFVKGYEGTEVQYIATQGPMDNTIEDFWRMVWENFVDIIIMATDFTERDIQKCERYWPAEGSIEYGHMEVTLAKHTSHQNFNEAILALKNTKIGETRIVRHYKLTVWPDQGVPENPRKVTDFLQKVKMADSEGPALVHCSAGIGRTGVIIAIDIGIQAILQGVERIDVLRIVSSIRRDRPGAVQTREQYRFIHQALLSFASDIQFEDGGSVGAIMH